MKNCNYKFFIMLFKHPIARTAKHRLSKVRTYWLYRWFWKFVIVRAESLLLLCIPQRSRLFWLNCPDIMEFSSWNYLACENIRFSKLFAAVDVSRGGTSAAQRQKFHTDDVKYLRNLVRSPDWSKEWLHCFSYCLRMTDKRQKPTKVKCKPDESLTKQPIFVEYSLL